MDIDLSTNVADLTVGELLQLLSGMPHAAISLTKKLLNVEEVAALLGYKVSNIYALTHRRAIPFTKKGRKLWFDKDEIEEWVKSGRKKTTTELQQTLSTKRGKLLLNNKTRNNGNY